MSYIVALIVLAVMAVALFASMIWSMGWRAGITLIVSAIAASALCTWAINVVVAHQ